MSPSATRVGELAHPGGRAMRGQGLWGGGTCRGRGWGRSGAERGVWRVGRRGPAPQTSPSPQVTPSSSRASTTGASPRAASKPSRTPPNRWVPSSWTAPPPVWALVPPDPPERPLSPETATVSAGSVRLQGGLRCPSCLFCPCWWGAGPPPEGDLRLRGRKWIAHGAPAGCGCGKSVPGAGLRQDAAGMPVVESPGGRRQQGWPWN